MAPLARGCCPQTLKRHYHISFHAFPWPSAHCHSCCHIALYYISSCSYASLLACSHPLPRCRQCIRFRSHCPRFPPSAGLPSSLRPPSPLLPSLSSPEALLSFLLPSSPLHGFVFSQSGYESIALRSLSCALIRLYSTPKRRHIRPLKRKVGDHQGKVPQGATGCRP